MNIKISKYYNHKQAEDYEARRNNAIWRSEDNVFKNIKYKIAPKYNNLMKILDVGAGTGRWIPHLQDIALKYVGTDISKNMLDQAKLKLNSCPENFKNNSKLIVAPVEKLQTYINGKFDLIIMTRFLSHFSIYEIKNIMKIIKNYSNGYIIVSLRVADNMSDIYSEIFELIIKSPLGAIKRYRKSGRLTYARLSSKYDKVIQDSGFKIVKKNLVEKNKRNRYEYWELTLS